MKNEKTTTKPAFDPSKGWFSAQELAGLPGMPTTDRGVKKTSEKNLWASRSKERGKGVEYALTSLPEATQQHLVGLMMDEANPSGFVFIDEPFAHLDVRNIQLVGHFLRSTRAQYVLTTPITHNVEVFEPADVTLVTAKKPKGARWAPPIGVLQRRPPAEVL